MKARVAKTQTQNAAASGNIAQASTTNNAASSSTLTSIKPQLTKQAFQVVKTLASNTGEGNSLDSTFPTSPSHTNTAGASADAYEADRQREKQLEAEIMGESNTKSINQQKSHAIEKNLNQMIKVLNSRLNALDHAAKLRLHLLEEDLKPLSNKMSKQAPKIVDEFDEVIPKSLRDTKAPVGATTSSNVNTTQQSSKSHSNYPS